MVFNNIFPLTRPTLFWSIHGLFILILFAAFFACGQSWGQSSDMKVEEEKHKRKSIEQKIKKNQAREHSLNSKAQKLSEEIRSLRAELILTGRETQERERISEALKGQLTLLERNQEAQEEALLKNDKKLQKTLQVLVRLSGDPPRAFFLYPGAPVDAVRATILLRSALPALEGNARILKEQIQALNKVSKDIYAKLNSLYLNEKQLAKDQQKLQELITRRQKLYGQTTIQSRRTKQQLRKLVEESRNLRELSRKLAAERDKKTIGEEENSANPASRSKQKIVLAPPPGLRKFPDRGGIIATCCGNHYQFLWSR